MGRILICVRIVTSCYSVIHYFIILDVWYCLPQLDSITLFPLNICDHSRCGWQTPIFSHLYCAPAGRCRYKRARNIISTSVLVPFTQIAACRSSRLERSFEGLSSFLVNVVAPFDLSQVNGNISSLPRIRPWRFYLLDLPCNECIPKMTSVRFVKSRGPFALGSRLTIKCTVTVTPHLNTWLKDAAPLDVAWKKRV